MKAPGDVDGKDANTTVKAQSRQSPCYLSDLAEGKAADSMEKRSQTPLIISWEMDGKQTTNNEEEASFPVLTRDQTARP